MAVGAGAIRAGRAFVELFADDSKFVAGLRNASRRLNAWGGEVQAVGLKVFAAGAAIGGALVGAALSFAKTGDALAKMSKRTGASVEALSELEFAAGRSGASAETLEKGLRGMARTLYDAERGLSTAVDVLTDMGLTVEDLKGKKPEDQFAIMAEALSKIKDPTLRSALALKAFGRSGAELLPLMQDGAAGIQKLREEARRLGLTISGEDAAAAEVFTDAMGDLWATIKRATFAIGAALAPTLQRITQWITRVVANIRQWIDNNRPLVNTLLMVSGVLLGVGAALLTVAVALKTVAFALTGLRVAMVAIGAIIKVAGVVIGALTSPIGLVVAAVVGLGAIFLTVTGNMGKLIDWISEKFAAMKAFVGETFRGIADAMASGDIQLAAQILWVSLKVIWQTGVNWLKEIWYGLRDAIINAMTSAWYSVLIMLNTVWGKLEEAWVNTVGFLGQVWAKFTGWLAKTWESIQSTLTDWMLTVGGWVGLLSDEEVGQAKALNKQASDLAQKRIDDETKADVKGREEMRKKRLAQIEQKINDTNELLVGKNDEQRAAREKASQEAIAANEKELDLLKKQRAELLKKAAAEREAQAAGGVNGAAYVPAGAAGAEDLNRKVVGTFTASMVGRVFANERLLNAVEKTEKHTKKLADKADEDDDGVVE